MGKRNKRVFSFKNGGADLPPAAPLALNISVIEPDGGKEITIQGLDENWEAVTQKIDIPEGTVTEEIKETKKKKQPKTDVSIPIAPRGFVTMIALVNLHSAGRICKPGGFLMVQLAEVEELQKAGKAVHADYSKTVPELDEFLKAAEPMAVTIEAVILKRLPKDPMLKIGSKVRLTIPEYYRYLGTGAVKRA